MRIYAVADLHGQPERLALIRKTVERVEPDVVVVAGDITNFRGAASVVGRINELPVPVLGIRGNSDRPVVDRWLAAFSNVRCLDRVEVSVNGVRFVGAGGTVPVPFRSRIRLRERAVLDRLSHLLPPASVLVPHPPPWGTLDEVFGSRHAGSKGIARLVDRCQPAIMICGHIHERAGIARRARTLVVNCNVAGGGAGALIDYAPGARPEAHLL